ncbi:MAG: hypothetical protein IPJ77_02300 [Planctomycetes bacterium]|nr:hypothetical protein [Planctomycetota bacterium]
MRRIRLSAGLQPIPRPYAPRYPVLLSPDEYRELVARRNHERVRALLAAAAIALASRATSAQAPNASSGGVDARAALEARVLGVLQACAERHAAPRNLALEHSANPNPSTPGAVDHALYRGVGFGTGMSHVFDRGEARRLARELFGAYGFELEPGTRVDSDVVHGRLDGANLVHKVGFDLVDRVPGILGDAGEVVAPEEPADALDDGELARLRTEGWRLHVVTTTRYSRDDAHDLTPLLAYALGLIEFLNAIDDGPDLDVRGLFFESAITHTLPLFAKLPWPEGKVPACQYSAQGGYDYTLKEPAKLVLRFPADATKTARSSHAEVWEDLLEPRTKARAADASGDLDATRAARPTSGLGTLHGLRLPFEPAFPSPASAHSRAAMRARIVQERAAPAAPLVIEAHAGFVFLGSEFDAAQPFRVEFELGPGDYRFDAALEIAFPRR